MNLQLEMREKLAAFAEHMASKGIHLTTDLADTLVAMHPALAEALLGNLLGNAIRHNLPAAGRLEIELSPARLRIRNTGASPDLPTDRLFERFRKAEASSSDSPGLGLSIVQEICRFYGFGLQYTFDDGWHEVTVQFN